MSHIGECKTLLVHEGTSKSVWNHHGRMIAEGPWLAAGSIGCADYLQHDIQNSYQLDNTPLLSRCSCRVPRRYLIGTIASTVDVAHEGHHCEVQFGNENDSVSLSSRLAVELREFTVKQSLYLNLRLYRVGTAFCRLLSVNRGPRECLAAKVSSEKLG